MEAHPKAKQPPDYKVRFCSPLSWAAGMELFFVTSSSITIHHITVLLLIIAKAYPGKMDHTTCVATVVGVKADD
jgi:hypothetical protein